MNQNAQDFENAHQFARLRMDLFSPGRGGRKGGRKEYKKKRGTRSRVEAKIRFEPVSFSLFLLPFPFQRRRERERARAPRSKRRCCRRRRWSYSCPWPERKSDGQCSLFFLGSQRLEKFVLFSSCLFFLASFWVDFDFFHAHSPLFRLTHPKQPKQERLEEIFIAISAIKLGYFFFSKCCRTVLNVKWCLYLCI